jgi:hypothetical protein
MANEKLMYPRPQVGDFHVHRLLHDMQEDEDLFVEFLGNSDAVLDRYPEVDDEAKRLIATHDYAGLQQRGLHPIMIVQFQRHIEWGMRMTASRAAATSVTDVTS